MSDEHESDEHSGTGAEPAAGTWVVDSDGAVTSASEPTVVDAASEPTEAEPAVTVVAAPPAVVATIPMAEGAGPPPRPYDLPPSAATGVQAGAPASAHRGRSTFVTAVIAAVVGALVASGVFLVADDGSKTTVVRTTAPIVARPSNTLAARPDVASIIDKVEPAVVAITTGAGPGSGSGGAGTGFVLTADGYIVTNNHVVTGAKKITVAFTSGDELSATIVGTEPANDLAVLKVSATNLPTVELGDSESVAVGDEVVAIGNALALDGGLSVTRGIISGLHRTVQTDASSTLIGMLQTDAAINPGNSGGPLVDANGKVIGINTAIANPASAQNIGFAIPISSAKVVIDDLRLGRAPSFLGVGTQTVTPAIAREQSLSVQSGALVVRITSGSPADKAGIKVGDVILEIGGKKVPDSSSVQLLVREHRPGDTVAVLISRDGVTRSVDAKLVERPTA